MILFACDYCSQLKDPKEVWIVGLAAEAVGVTAARREVTILPMWERPQIVDALAVHFCSDECRDNYIRQLFEQEPLPAPPARKTVRRKSKVARRTKRAA
jgi:hypothetical protein